MKTKNTHQVLKTISLLVICSFYIVAGYNHFRDPKFYLALIPPYFPDHSLINIVSGVFEIIAGILMIIPFTRKIAAYLIIAIFIYLKKLKDGSTVKNLLGPFFMQFIILLNYGRTLYGVPTVVDENKEGSSSYKELRVFALMYPLNTPCM